MKWLLSTLALLHDIFKRKPICTSRIKCYRSFGVIFRMRAFTSWISVRLAGGMILFRCFICWYSYFIGVSLPAFQRQALEIWHFNKRWQNSRRLNKSSNLINCAMDRRRIWTSSWTKYLPMASQINHDTPICEPFFKLYFRKNNLKMGKNLELMTSVVVEFHGRL